MGLTGSIINVPIHMDVVQKSLPQSMDETLTIVVALKQHLQYKNAYQTGRVRVNIVMRALKELSSKNLYRVENICINEDWNHVLQEENANSTQNAETNTQSDTDGESNNENPTETLVHGLIESQRIRDLQDKIIELTPTEGKHVHLEFSRTNMQKK
jgi:hypothetical protein